MASSASGSMPTPDPALVLFARGVIARLELWPALRVAVEQGWGGPESLQKRRWLASVIVNAFEQHRPTAPTPPPPPPLPPSPPLSCSNSPSSSPCMMSTVTMLTSGMSTGIQVNGTLDVEYIAVMLAQVLEDEFDASFEDGSVEAVAADIVGLWGASEEVVREWERRAEGARGKSVNLQEVVDDEDEWEDEESEGSGDDGDGDGDEEAPQLMTTAVSTRRPAKPEPVVDEDGFTLVQKRR